MSSKIERPRMESWMDKTENIQFSEKIERGQQKLDKKEWTPFRKSIQLA